VGVRVIKGEREESLGQYPDSFNKSMDFIRKWEGGLSDHPDDNGGRTMMGITKEVADRHGYNVDDITKEIATEIFYTDYWKTVGCGEFEYPLAMACLNTAINSGVGKAAEFNELIGDGDVREEAIPYAQRQEDYYRDIVSRKRDQEVFLQGWLNRSKDLKKRISN